jgi:hypothetical protein
VRLAGRLLTLMGVYKSAPVVQAPEEPAAAEDLGWRALVPPIRHFEPANELEFFDPQLRDKDPTRTFARPWVPHKDGVVVKVRLVVCWGRAAANWTTGAPRRGGD